MSTDTKTLPLLSLRNLVLFPGAVMPRRDRPRQLAAPDRGVGG